VDYILDACALIALINQEEGEDVVDGLLKRAELGEITVIMNAINLTEVLYGYIRASGMEKAVEILETVKSTAIRIIETFPEQVYLEASCLKVAYSMSLADVFALATASCTNSTIVTSDGELKPIETSTERINIYWFRPPKEKK
jgi:predicted nucleic acid-binding protein